MSEAIYNCFSKYFIPRIFNYLNGIKNKWKETKYDWPQQLPGFNAIENMWLLLKAKISTRFPKTIDELWNVKNLYEFIQRRFETVIKMKRNHSTY